MASDSITASWVIDSEPICIREIMVKYSRRSAVNIKQNKIAVVNWVFCQSFRVTTFWKYKNILVLMILKVRKDFMVLEQRDLIYCELTYSSWLSIRSKQCLPLLSKINEATLSLSCELGISSQVQFCLQIKVSLWRKKRSQIFSKIVRASKLTRQRTL